MNVFCGRIGSVALAISATQCCVSAEKARAMWAEVKSQNQERYRVHPTISSWRS
jgi:hypothetical protein